MGITKRPRPTCAAGERLCTGPLGRAVAALLLAVALLATVACGATQADPAAQPQSRDGVYRLLVRAVDAPGTRTEWIDVESGAWRIEEGEETAIFTGDSYVTMSALDGVAVRTGSSAYLGSLADRAVSRPALASYLADAAKDAGVEVSATTSGKTELQFRAGAIPLKATIAERITAAEAAKRDLFTVPANPRTMATEVPVGVAASIPVRAYWFGPSVDGRDAVTAVEHFTPLTDELLSSPGWGRRDGAIVHETFYELPSAEGKSSALPGQSAPDGEIMVVSQPLRAPVAQAAIDAYNGTNGDLEYEPWPRQTVTLANGEQAVLIPDRGEGTGRVRAFFAVITATTLVNVVAPVATEDMAALAQQLRPL
jgi:hypothetical protein